MLFEGRQVERITGDRIWAQIATAPPTVDQLMNFVATADAGATVVFSGTVRSHSQEHSGVVSIDYEAHEALAIARLHEIAEEALTRFHGIHRIALYHRVGNVALGDSSVIVACSATHRGDAFDAARFIIDTVKKAVPIWKNERFHGGTDWVSGETLISSISPGLTQKEVPLS